MQRRQREFHARSTEESLVVFEAIQRVLRIERVGAIDTESGRITEQRTRLRDTGNVIRECDGITRVRWQRPQLVAFDRATCGGIADVQQRTITLRDHLPHRQLREWHERERHVATRPTRDRRYVDRVCTEPRREHHQSKRSVCWCPHRELATAVAS